LENQAGRREEETPQEKLMAGRRDGGGKRKGARGKGTPSGSKSKTIPDRHVRSRPDAAGRRRGQRGEKSSLMRKCDIRVKARERQKEGEWAPSRKGVILRFGNSLHRESSSRSWSSA